MRCPKISSATHVSAFNIIYLLKARQESDTGIQKNIVEIKRA